MLLALSLAVVAVALLVGAWAAVVAARDRWVGNDLLIGLLLLEVLSVVQLVVAVVTVIAGTRPGETATYLSYALTAPLIVPVGVFWSVAEKSRSSILVITVACVAVAAMTGRMIQIWGAGG